LINKDELLLRIDDLSNLMRISGLKQNAKIDFSSVNKDQLINDLIAKEYTS
jgi:hypothetical protein